MPRPVYPTYTRHPLSSAYGDMPAEDFAALKADLKDNGQQMPIVIHEGKVLDGWHRYTALRDLYKAKPDEAYLPLIDEEPVPDPVSFVQSLNGHRRHLSLLDRINAFAAVHNLSLEDRGVAAKVAKGMGVTPALVSRALKVPKAPAVREKSAPTREGLEKQLAMAEGRVASIKAQLAAMAAPVPRRAKR
jgi:hypothetical protein